MGGLIVNKEVMFSSATDQWATPQDFFDKLDEEFHFTLDPCSTHENAKCNKHYTVEDDGLKQDWSGEIVFCNPPYGKEMPKWIKKCAEHAHGGGYFSHVNTRKDRYQSIS
jgi:site-specific DNA-methyltransferase (adenine-specific)